MISRGRQQAIFFTVIGIVAVCTISSCSYDAKVSGNREMIDWIHNKSTAGSGTENAGEEGRSWYFPGKEQFYPWGDTRNGADPAGVLYMGFRNEIKVQLFSEYLFVSFREVNFAFRVYKNCKVEFII